MNRLPRIMLTLAVLTGIASAEPIISNLDAQPQLGTLFNENPNLTTFKACAFTMGAQPYRLDAVTIEVSDIGPAPVQADLQLWTGSGTPTTLVTALVGPAFTSAGAYTFTPTTEVFLSAGETYWVYANNSFQGTYRWDGRATDPTGPAATSAGYVFNGNPSAFPNAFAVEGTPLLIGNLDAPDFSSTAFGANTTTTFKAAGFRIGSQSHDFEGVVLALGATGGSARADVQLWTGESTPQTFVSTLSGPQVGFDGLYTFAPNAPITLTGNTTYWIYVANSFPDEYRWLARSEPPTGSGATSAGYIFNGSPSSLSNAYGILARPVPEVISNLDASVAATGTTISPTLSFKAAGFTMGPASYELRDVDIAVSRAEPGTVATVEIWAGSTQPIQRSTTLASRTVDADGIYKFVPTEPFVLGAGETYWIYLPGTAAGRFEWDARTADPSGIGATSIGYIFNGAPSSVRNGYAINGREVVDLACSPADLSSPAAPGSPDGVLTGADFFEFLVRFQAGDLSVDFSSPASPGTPDGVLSGADFFEFLNLFAAGC